MSKEKYHQLLSDVIENSLLHLYGQLAINKRFVPTDKRNDILKKFLKPKVNHPRYKTIKGDIKRMILAGKRKDGDLEAKLNELYDMVLVYQNKTNGAQKLYDLLNILFNEHQFDSRLFDESVKSEPEVIYVLKDHLVNCFNDSGQQIAPVSLLIESARGPSLIEIINDTNLFLAELKGLNESTWQVHIELHPCGHK
ncbi:DUF2913 family protein [Pseudomonadota bacterium]